MKSTACIKTFGCQMNRSDSEALAFLLRSQGFLLVSDYKEADLILLNTCSIRKKAEEKAINLLRELSSLKKERPGLILGIAGCVAKRLDSKLLRLIPSLDLVLSPDNLGALPDLLERLKEERGPQVATGEARDFLPLSCSFREDGLTASLSVVSGCENFCSYCIVPYVRGKLRSRGLKEIAEEAGNLSKSGYKEITLLGQNICAYGRDLGSGENLASLLAELNRIDGIERIRFVTSHPKDLSDELIEAIGSLSKVCEHIHLPLQAGSDKILRLMRRGYTLASYKEKVGKLRLKMPGISITTDLIVGFPGETESDFKETLEAVKDLRFDACFTFAFSPREGTKAFDLKEGLVPDVVKKERLTRLIEISKEITRRKNESLCQSLLEVLIEGENPRTEKESMGRSRTDKIVFFPGNGQAKGDIVDVKITEASTYYLRGITTSTP
ncbi:tRNA (N6-isopentenyl adenosine(37)-C2)-methylthiotransferase MiaB [bacterium]|nr:tRNA (N6-isopentenyl adenosine(37)-C2)-methylthiotransferase MiaB [bacterium]